MNPETLRRLEFDKIIEMLAGQVSSEVTRELVYQLLPQTDYQKVQELLQETSEGCNLLRLEPSFVFGGWHDIRRAVARADKGVIIEGQDLFAVAETLGAARRTKHFFAERADRYPLLAAQAEQICPLAELEKTINRSVMPSGEIADQASPELARWRRQMEQCRQRIRSQLEHVIRSPNYQKYLQDALVTIRDNRYVVPVKQEYRSMVPGLIHDQSSSGATLFIEPMAVVESNNELKRATLAEKQEVDKILLQLSNRVMEAAASIKLNLLALCRIDFILAKARLSAKMRAVEPRLNQNGYFNLKAARHPLLSGEVVPIDLQLGADFSTIVITGPNTGGKTVTLKTAGLLALMAQAGLHIPAREESEVTIFQQVFADIGDEQSIEQSLSTFSSHLKNIVVILQQADRQSLVLVDELGAGTDPTEGAALAMAVLEELYERGARVIATTHYSELKNFAYAHERVENASVEFDVATLRPTYRLLLGKPGRSNAFEIAEKLGVTPLVTARARTFMTEEQLSVAELMNNLEESQQQCDREQARVGQLRAELEELEKQYQLRSAELEHKREEIISKAQEQAWQLVREARLEAKELLSELKEKIKLAETAQLSRDTSQLNQKVNHLADKYQRNLFVEKQPEAGKRLTQVVPGQDVFLPRLNQKAVVLQPVNEQGLVQIQAGIIKMLVPVSDLQQASEPKAAPPKPQATARLQDKSISLEVDLRGMNAEEALLTLDKYIDNALLSNISRFTVIHGIGTGVLRAAVQQYLKSNKNVKRFRLGMHGEGSIGVTIVELK